MLQKQFQEVTKKLQEIEQQNRDLASELNTGQ